MSKSLQSIRYATTRDGVRLAWAATGNGPALVKAANWITHLEYDWESPVWRHWVQFLSTHFSLLRYDERGCGLSQRDVEDLADKNWLPDLEDVIGAAKPEKPFVLLGISQGACAAVAYAARYPEHVSHLVIYGGFVQGWSWSQNPDRVREARAMVDLTEIGWGRPDPTYRRLLTKVFLPEASEEYLQWFDRLCAQTIHPKTAAELLLIRGQADFIELLPRVSTPTLVIHANKDQVTPLSQGQLIAAGIPGAEFLQVDSRNHILLEEEPAWQRFKDAVLDFTGVETALRHEALQQLSKRENEVLAQLVNGLTNAQIGEKLFISEKTVRNQLTRIFEKLGVKNRAQAIIQARDQGVQPGKTPD